MWQASSLKPGLCCAAAAAAGLRIQDCRETQEAPAQDQYAINALKFPPYPRGTMAVQSRTAKSLISGCTEGHSFIASVRNMGLLSPHWVACHRHLLPP
ncbi:unnamed protein product [Sphagnum balticum]